MILEVFIKNSTFYNIQKVSDFLKEMASLLEISYNTQVSVLFCNNEFIKDLNLKYRNKNKATDVLSFPAEMEFILGDIVISLEQAKEQAKENLKKETEMLLCHGFLHLIGYDHEKSEQDHKIMMDLQTYLLKTKKTEILIV